MCGVEKRRYKCTVQALHSQTNGSTAPNGFILTRKYSLPSLSSSPSSSSVVRTRTLLDDGWRLGGPDALRFPLPRDVAGRCWNPTQHRQIQHRQYNSPKSPRESQYIAETTRKTPELKRTGGGMRSFIPPDSPAKYFKLANHIKYRSTNRIRDSRCTRVCVTG